MHELRKDQVVINDVNVKTFAARFDEDAAAVRAEAGSTGITDSDRRGDGGRTYVSLFCHMGDFLVTPLDSDQGKIRGVQISGCGDSALLALYRAVCFVRTALEDAIYPSVR